MHSDDPLREIVHDHGALNRMVRELGARVRGGDRDVANEDHTLVRLINSLREELFRHFAREEEGLFPFISEVLPELDVRVQEIAVAHDTICGALSRLFHLSVTSLSTSALEPVFTRFESAYAAHSALEGVLLLELGPLRDAGQRARLADLVRHL